MKEDKPSLAEKVSSYLEASPARSITDDEVLQMVGEEFFKPPEPEVVVKEVIPPGFIAAPEIMRYERLRREDPDFDQVRQRMTVSLTEAQQAECDQYHEAFNLAYAQVKQELVAERMARQEAESEARERLAATKKWYRSRMESSDPKVREKAELDYLERFVNWKS